MKIALIGYGKMGHAIEQIAIARGHEIVSIIDINNPQDFDSPAFASAQVAIEFTTPSTAVENYKKAFARGVKVVSGSTGWLAQRDEIKAMCDSGNATMFYTSNFSIGVNIFFAVNKYLAKVMNDYSQYNVDMTEIHHVHKKDHPSGTAISLAQGIIDNLKRKEAWTEDRAADASQLLITSEREGEVPGTHIVRYTSAIDKITIEHEAFSRAGFALGAVMAAEWLADKGAGWYDMSDMMKL